MIDEVTMLELQEDIRELQQLLVALSIKVKDLRPSLAVASKSYIDQLISEIQQTRNRLTEKPTPGSVTHGNEKLASYRAQYQELIQERDDPGYLARRDLSIAQGQLGREQEQVISLKKELSEANKALKTAKKEKLNVQDQLDKQRKEFEIYKKLAVKAKEEFEKRIVELKQEIMIANSENQDQAQPPMSKHEISKKEMKFRLKKAEWDIADFQREIEKYQRKVTSLNKEISALNHHVAIANAASQSSQERLIQSYEARRIIEQDLAELRKTDPLPSTPAQPPGSSKPKPVQKELELLNASIKDKSGQIRRLQQEVEDAKKKLKDVDHELELKSGDAKRFKTAWAALQKDAAEFNGVKAELQIDVENLRENVAAKEKDIAQLTERKHDMYEKMMKYKEKYDTVVDEKKQLEEENRIIKRKWKEVTHAMISFAETWKEPEEDKGGMTPREELSRANAALVAARSPQKLHDPWSVMGNSPKNPQSQNRRGSTITRRTEVDEDYDEPEKPTTPLKQKEESKILGYTKVAEVSLGCSILSFPPLKLTFCSIIVRSR